MKCDTSVTLYFNIVSFIDEQNDLTIDMVSYLQFDWTNSTEKQEKLIRLSFKSFKELLSSWPIKNFTRVTFPSLLKIMLVVVCESEEVWNYNEQKKKRRKVSK